MLIVFEQVAILMLFCLAGFVLSKAKIVNPEHGKTLSGLEVYLFMPCVSFRTFSTRFTMAYLQEKYLLLVVSVGLLLLLVLLAKPLSRILAPEGYERSVTEFSLIVPNCAYMGYALAGSLFGPDVLLDVMIFALPISTYIYTFGYNLLLERKDTKFSLKKIFTPVVIGMLAGCVVGLSGIAVPEFLGQVTEKSAACMAPVAMLLIGITLSQFRLRELLSMKRVYAIAAIRLLVIPLLVFGLLKLLKLDFLLLPAVLIHCMPCGMNSIIFPKLVGRDCRSAAATVMVSTLLSLITIPLCLHFLISP